MATEAAWLTANRLTKRRKKKCALTSIGLLMEGLGAILPVDPVYRMRRKVGIHRFAESCKEGLFAKAREESEAFQLVLDRILHLCKAQFDAGGVQGVI